MVPERLADIPAALDAALCRAAQRARSDVASCLEAIYADGAARLAALADSADELRERLAHALAKEPQTSENAAEGADRDE